MNKNRRARQKANRDAKRAREAAAGTLPGKNEPVIRESEKTAAAQALASAKKMQSKFKGRET